MLYAKSEGIESQDWVITAVYVHYQESDSIPFPTLLS